MRCAFAAQTGDYKMFIDTTPTPEPTADEFLILSIDAWREMEGWTWNNWYTVGAISKDCVNWKPRQILKWFRVNGFLTENSVGKCAVFDDDYNIVIVARGTGRPLFAIEYGRFDQ